MLDITNPEFKRKLLFGIALACGALALIMLYSYINTQKEQNQRQIELMKKRLQEEAQKPQQPQTTVVLVAAREIQQGAVISSDDISTKEFPKEYVTPGAFTSNFNIIGLTALTPISYGAQIVKNMVGQPEKPKLLSAITPPGKRAVTVSIDNSLIGFLQPGDYVDVLALITPPEGSPLYSLAKPTDKTVKGIKADKVTIPLFQNVLVLAVGSNEKKEKSNNSTARDSSTVTLSLNPQESALIAFVQEQGKIKLVMRSNSDVGDTAVQAVDWDSLFEYLYPGSRERMLRKPTTVEVYHGLSKEVLPLEEGRGK